MRWSFKMWFLFSLTLLSIFIKIWVFNKVLHARSANLVNQLVFLVACCALFQSFIEIIGYFFTNQFSEQSLLYALKTYYISLIVFTVTQPFIVYLMIGRQLNTYVAVLSIVTMNIIFALILFSDSIIAGVEVLDYTITRIQGEYYWVFQVGPFVAISFTIYTLISKIITAETYYLKIRCINMLMAFAPLAIFLPILIVLMQLGYQINAIGFLPLFMSLYLVIIALNLTSQQVPDFSFLIPGSPKQKLLYKIFKKVCRLESEDQPINPEAYQRLLVKYAVEVSKGNQREAAKLLNTSPSTVSRMMRRQSKE